MDTAVVFVANIPFYVYYNYSVAPIASPRYRTLLVSEIDDEISLVCLDGCGSEVMPYPEYILALFTYFFEVRGRYKKRFIIRCIDGTHTYRFYIDSAHKYGVNVDVCKEIFTFKVKMTDSVELEVADLQGYDRIRLLYVESLDCFSEGVLGQLRFLKATANCERVAAFSYMDALRLVSLPSCDLSAEMLVAIWHVLAKNRKCDFPKSFTYYPLSVREIDGEPICFASAVAGALLS